jgi:hypothetical protein
LEDERHRIGLLQYNLSTACTVKKRIFIYIEGNSGSDLDCQLHKVSFHQRGLNDLLEGQAFLRSYDSAPRPSPSPLSSQQVVSSHSSVLHPTAIEIDCRGVHILHRSDAVSIFTPSGFVALTSNPSSLDRRLDFPLYLNPIWVTCTKPDWTMYISRPMSSLRQM